MGMESVYKLSVILNMVDNLSGQMGGVGTMCQALSTGSIQPLEPCRRQGRQWQG